MRQFLPKFILNKSSFYYTSRSNGLVMRADISFDSKFNSLISVTSTNNYVCTEAFGCIYTRYQNYEIFYNPGIGDMVILLSDSPVLGSRLTVSTYSISDILWVNYDTYSATPINIYMMRNGYI